MEQYRQAMSIGKHFEGFLCGTEDKINDNAKSLRVTPYGKLMKIGAYHMGIKHDT